MCLGDGEASSRFWPSLKSAALSRSDFPMTRGEQIRDFQPVDSTALQLLDCLNLLYTNPKSTTFLNLGTGQPQSLLSFAQSQWNFFNASGSLIPGAVSIELMRYFAMFPSLLLYRSLC